MKKIALIYYHPLSSIDGATKVIKSFVDNSSILESNGISIDVFAPTSYSGVEYNTKTTKGRVIHFLKNIIFKLDFTGELRMMYNLYVRCNRAVQLYDNRASQIDYDAIFVHDLLTCYNYLKRGEGKPVILVMHTTGDLLSMTLSYFPLLRYTLFYNIVLKKALKTVLSKVDRIVFNSKLAADNFLKIYPNVKSGLAAYVNNGISDLASIELINDHPAYPPYTFVCVGSISERKGQRFIVEALKRCTEKEQERVRFLFVGDGDIKNELEEECKQFRLKIEFCGLQKDVVPFLKQANIFILPSVDEGMPISILEAMRQGLPIVSTNVGGIPYQVVDGLTGVLINASTEGVKLRMETLDSFNWKKMGEKSRERYEQEFGINQMMIKYAGIMKEVCKC